MRNVFERPQARTSTKRSARGHRRLAAFSPRLERLEDRRLLSITTFHSVEDGTVTAPGSVNELALEITAADESTVLGFWVEAADGSALDPARPTILDDGGNAVSQITGDADRNGGSASMAVVELGPGSYTVQVSGDRGTFGDFQLGVFLPGDTNGDGRVGNDEFVVTTAAVLQNDGGYNAFTAQFYRTRHNINLAEDDLYRPELDVDLNGQIDAFDLEQIEKNTSSPTLALTLVGDQEAPTIDAALANDDGISATDRITSDPIVTGSVTDESDVVELKGRFTASPENAYTDLTGLLDLDGNFTIDLATLATMDDSPVVNGGGFNVIDGQYTLELVARDGQGNEHAVPVELSYTVIADNDAPNAVDDAAGTDEESIATGNVLANDSDPDVGDVISVIDADTTSTLGAVVTVTPNGAFSYDPNGQFDDLAVGDTATDTFTYTIQDALGATATATVTVTVNGVNDAPIAVADTAATDEDSTTTGNVLANDTDVDTGDTLSVVNVDASAALGDLDVNLATGEFTYDPNGQFENLAAGDTATDSFQITIEDNHGAQSTATLTVTITGVNDAPVAVDDSATTDEDNPTTGNLLANDSDVDDGDALAIVDVDTTGTLGDLSYNASTGAFTYDPNGQFENLAVGDSVVETFQYTIEDTHGEQATATLTVTINGANDAPTAVDDAGATDEDTATAGNVLGNDFDVDDGDTFEVINSDATSAMGAAVTVDANGDFTYDPSGSATLQQLAESGAPANDTFTYTIEDAAGATATATVTITVSGVNDAPIANDDTASTDEDNPTTGNLLSNDTDVDTGDVLTIIDVDTTGTLGDFSFDANTGEFTYDPNGQFEDLAVGETATETYQYTIEDQSGEQATATLTVTVTGANDAPVADDDDATTDEDTPVTIDVLAGDTDVDASDTLTISDFDTTSAAGAAVSQVGNQLEYDPTGVFDYLDEGDSTTDTFQYTVSDGNGGSDTATVTVTVNGVNDAPIVVDVTFTVDPDDPNGTLIGTVDVDDADADDTHKFFFTGSTPAAGTSLFAIDEDTGEITVADSASLVDGTSFDLTVEVTDLGGTGETDTAIVTINVVANQPPTAQDDEFTTDEDSTVAGNVLVDNGNGADSDPESDPITVTTTGVDLPADNGGLYTIDAAGNVTYDPNGAFEDLAVGEQATDTFTYTITDGIGGTDTATVTVTINGANDAPTAADDADTTDEDSSIVIDVLPNDTDPDTSDTLTVDSVDDTGTLGTVTTGGTDVTYDPAGAFDHLAPGEQATDTFTYTVSDGNGGTDTATVTVTINGVNDAPVLIAAAPNDATDHVTPVTVDLADMINNGAGTTDIVDVDASDPVGGVAIIGLVGNGTWAYSLNGTDFTDIAAAPAADAALLLPSTATLRYTPDGFNAETATISYRAWDTSTGSIEDTNADTTVNGGTTAFSIASDTLSVDVIPGNRAPQVEGGGISDVLVAKDGDPQPDPINLVDHFSDPDGDTLTFDIDDPGNDINTELIDVDLTGNTLTITYASYTVGQDRSPSTIVVTATDPDGLSVTDTFTVTIVPEITIETQLVVLASPTSEADAEGLQTLPTSLSDITVGDTFFVEIWMKDMLTAAVTDGPVTNGLAGAAFDLNFDQTLVQADLLHHDGLFEFLTVGAIDNAAGEIEGFGGGNPFASAGIEPEFVRLGYVEFTATASGDLDFSLDLDNNGRDVNQVEPPSRQATGGAAIGTVDVSQVDLATASITQSEAPPLMGSQVGDPVAADTGIYMSVVEATTTVDARGHVAAVPESAEWIDEWDSYWVELWVNTAEGPGLTAASVDLNYNTDYFTATGVELGPAFSNELGADIDDALGLVAELGGSATLSNVGGDGFALLGRVKFESLDGDNVPIDIDSPSFGPLDLGLSVSNAQVEVDGVGAVEAGVAPAPSTELWGVVYDVDDDGRIGFGDFSHFATAFQQEVITADSPMAAALDFNRSGRVDFGDFAYFSANFQHHKGSELDVQFPSNFTQRWIGTIDELDGTASIEQLLDAATETWQNALGLPEPIDVQLIIRDYGDAQLGEGQILAVNDDGRPVAGRVVLDDDAGGVGWYASLDEPVAPDNYDLYTVLLHEIGHTLGFTRAYAGFESYVVSGNGGQKLFFHPDFTVELDRAAHHLASDAHPGDLMSATLAPGIRRLPSAIDVQVLAAAYDAARAGADGFTTYAAALQADAGVAPTTHRLGEVDGRLTDHARAGTGDLGFKASVVGLIGLDAGTPAARGTADADRHALRPVERLADTALIELQSERLSTDRTERSDDRDDLFTANRANDVWQVDELFERWQADEAETDDDTTEFATLDAALTQLF